MSPQAATFILALITVTESRAQRLRNDAEIVRFENDNDGLGTYRFAYETSDDIIREETGAVTNPESDNSILVVRGFYSYTADNGRKYEVHYIADENGFRPEISNPSLGGAPSLFRPTQRPPTTSTTEKQPDVTIIPIIGSAAIGSLAGGGLGR